MNGKYYFAVRDAIPRLKEVHRARCELLAQRRTVIFLGTFYSPLHAMQAARKQYPDCCPCPRCMQRQAEN